MSWLFSQVLVEEYLGDISLDGEQSAPLSGNNTQQAYCAPDKMTKFSRLSRFGMTYKPLTESRGEELCKLYREAFLVRTFQPQEKVQELTANDQECGEKWHGLLARFDQDTHLWRTVQCSLIGDLNESLQTLPQWGMTVGGELYLRQTLVQTIKEKESGYWLTPSTVDIPVRSQESMEKRLDYRAKIGRNGVGAGCLSEQVEWSQDGPPIGNMTRNKFPIPLASDWKPRGTNSKQQGLAEVVKMWPTPRSCSAMAATITPESSWNEKRKLNLETVVGQRMWPTPKTQDSRHALNRHNNPNDSHWKSNLGEVVSAQVNGGHLNPTWVEWLMGWPLGWTDLKPLVMDKSLYVQQLHGSYLNE